jgi:hypothetical protein
MTASRRSICNPMEATLHHPPSAMIAMVSATPSAAIAHPDLHRPKPEWRPSVTPLPNSMTRVSARETIEAARTSLNRRTASEIVSALSDRVVSLDEIPFDRTLHVCPVVALKAVRPSGLRTVGSRAGSGSYGGKAMSCRPVIQSKDCSPVPTVVRMRRDVVLIAIPEQENASVQEYARRPTTNIRPWSHTSRPPGRAILVWNRGATHCRSRLFRFKHPTNAIRSS